MKLKDLIKSKMLKDRYRSSDIADALGKSRQNVSIMLNRPLNRCTLRTIELYCSAVGMRFSIKKMLQSKN